MGEQTDGSRRLTGWKEIAGFFGRDERTVKRWETGRSLPIHRLPGGKRGSVFAYAHELEVWLRSAGAEPEDDASAASVEVVPAELRPDIVIPAAALQTRFGRVVLALAILAACAATFAAGTVVARVAGLTPLGPAGAANSAFDVGAPSQEAIDLYLTGVYNWNTRTPDGLRRAVDYFTQAIALAPDYAKAYAGLANAYNLLAQYTIAPADETYPRAKAAAERAIALDDTLAAAHAALGFNAFYWQRDFVRSKLELEEAMRLDPGSVDAHHWYALTRMHFAAFDEPLRAITRAQELAPQARSVLANKALILFHAGQVAEAQRLLRQLTETDPDFIAPRFYLATIALAESQYEDFLREARRAAELQKNGAQLAVLDKAAEGLRARGGEGMLEAILEGQKQQFAAGKEKAFALARTEAQLGDRDAAISYLEQSIVRREPDILGILLEPAFRPLRSDPAYRALVGRVGLPVPPAVGA